MKFYIELIEEQFVCDAETPVDAIAKFWKARIRDSANLSCDDPEIETAYLVHLGRVDDAVVIQSGPAYLLIDPIFRPIIRRWIAEHSPKLHQQFCQAVVDAASEPKE